MKLLRERLTKPLYVANRTIAMVGWILALTWVSAAKGTKSDYSWAGTGRAVFPF
jgi:hypothetical protein